MNDFQGSFSNIYTAASLKVPWHAILGNHDYGDGDHSQSPNSCTLVSRGGAGDGPASPTMSPPHGSLCRPCSACSDLRL